MATSQKLTPPTSLVGYTSEEVWFQSVFAETNELVPELIWPESVFTYNQMRRDPQLAAILSAFTLPIRRAAWAVDPAGCKPEVAQLVADDLGLPVKGDDKPTAARVRGVSWSSHLRSALLHLAFGHYPFELGATINTDGQARLTVLSERIPHTITDIQVNRDGTLRGYTQFAMPGEKETEEITADRTVWYVHDREGANWTGTSLLRPAYAAWLIKREMQRVHATSNRRWGMGVPVMEALPGTNPTQEQMANAQRLAASARAGETGGAATPPGFTLNIKGLTGSVPDTLSFIKWLDQQMSRMVLAGFLDLGETMTGSRALGESFIDLFMLSIQSIGDYVAETVTREVAARIVGWNWGDDEPVPTVAVADVASTHEVTAESLAQLMQFGAIAPDPALDEYVRNLWGLPARTGPWVAPKAGGGPGPTPNPTPTPEPTAQPVAASASRAVRAAAGDTTDADQQVGHRQPTAEEQAAGVDFQSLAAAHTAAVAALLAAWPSLTASITATLAEQAAAAVAGGDLSGLNDIAVPDDERAALVDAIAKHMDALSLTSAAQAVAEAAHQGVKLAKPRKPGADQNQQVAEVLAQTIVDGYTTAARKAALQVSGGDEAAVQQAVEDALRALGQSDTGWAADNANAAMSAAQAAGRGAVFEAAGPGTVWLAAELLDQNTCSACRDVDGTRYDNWADALAAYPLGPYAKCKGRWRCRGQLVALHGGGMPSRSGPSLANVSNVELMYAGSWDLSSGPATFSRDDLVAAAAAQACPAVRRPVLKFGHLDGRVAATTEDGQPTIGWVDGMRTDLDGHLLVGNYRGLPAWMTEVDDHGNSVIASAFPDRSIEGTWNYVCQLGHTHPFVVTAVALLGETPPGIGTLASLQDVAALYTGVAASSPTAGQPVTVTIHAASKEPAVPSPNPQMVAASVSVDDLRKEFNERAPWDQWITEIQLDPLQLIVIDDGSQTLWRVPVTIAADGTITFGTPVQVQVTYVDQAPDDDAPVIASAPQRTVFAARAESRPGDRPAPDPQTAAPARPRQASAPAVAAPAPAAAPAPTLPAAEPEPPTDPKEDPVSDLSEIRSRLGLPDDADESAILAALDELKAAKPTEPAAPAQGEPAAGETTPAGEPALEPVAASAAKPVATPPDPRIEAMAAQLNKATTELAEIRAAAAANTKKNMLDAAQREGKFTPADRQAWEKRYDQAPGVITEVLAAIAPGTAVPVTLAGYPGNPETAADDESDLDALFEPGTLAPANSKEA